MNKNLLICTLLLAIALCVGACTGCSGSGTYTTTTTAAATAATTTTTAATADTTAVPEPADEITTDVMGIVTAIDGSVLSIAVGEIDEATDDLTALDAASLTVTGETGSVVVADDASIRFVYDQTLYDTTIDYIIEGDTLVVTYDEDGMQTVTILEAVEESEEEEA